MQCARNAIHARRLPGLCRADSVVECVCAVQAASTAEAAHRAPLKVFQRDVEPLVGLRPVARHRIWNVTAHDVRHHGLRKHKRLVSAGHRVRLTDLLGVPRHAGDVVSVAEIVQRARRSHQLLHEAHSIDIRALCRCS